MSTRCNESQASWRIQWTAATLAAATLLLSGCTTRASATAGGLGDGAAGMPVRLASVSAASAPARLKPVDIDYMLRGYFYAGSPLSEGLGGNATSDNLPRQSTELPFPGGGTWPQGLHLRAFPEEQRTFDGHDGLRVVIVNASGAPIGFDAQDGRIDVVQEAFHDGEWKPVEYLPGSSCGNSYHTLTLESTRRRASWTPTTSSPSPAPSRQPHARALLLSGA